VPIIVDTIKTLSMLPVPVFGTDVGEVVTVLLAPVVPLGLALFCTSFVEVLAPGVRFVTTADPVPLDVTVAVLEELVLEVSDGFDAVVAPSDVMPVTGLAGLLFLLAIWSYAHLPAKNKLTIIPIATKSITKLIITAIGLLTESVVWIYCAGAVNPLFVRCQNRAITCYSL
jgi:hypothetical protein